MARTARSRYAVVRQEAAKIASGARKRATIYKKAYERGKPSIQKAAFITAGGAAAGFVNAQLPDIAGIPTPLIVGAGFVAGSLYLGNDAKDANDGMAYTLLCLGSGMLAVSAANYVENMAAGGILPTIGNQGQTLNVVNQ
jgi:hypothetical protein